ncbi:NHLP bacteriocin system secretion protein [Desulfovibrio ferrophilus]|uniref:NHLM bacteriocin system secretion protein n=1 Tax=Desulfovibrio ferrophilus TaxID=241368 RepID=A0A2Z6AY89_9BACT|nr:NHLP bacteriocin system secretion protein [Desulfovibrio ferrophilus]BBD08234.1 NHLM bacteriocin system secretion protein [Desulfovibrio ferrophilus]
MAGTSNKGKQTAVSSPDELTRLINIVDSKGIYAVVTGLVLLLALLVWSFVGTVPVTVNGMGILIPPEGLMDVVAVGHGQISDVSVKPGDVLHKGDVLAVVQQPRMENERLKLVSELENAKLWLHERSAYYERTIAMRQGNDAEQSDLITFQRAHLNDYFDFLRKFLSDLEHMDRGFITKKYLQDIRNQKNMVMSEMSTRTLQLSEMDTNMFNLRSEAELDLLGNQEKVIALELALRSLERDLNLSSHVTSPFDGRVVEVIVERGAYVSEGQAVAVLEPLNSPLEAMVLLPVEQGKKVEPGMVVYVYPSTAEKEEYGCIYGKVKDVSDYPVSAQSLLKGIGRREVVNAMLESGVMIGTSVTLLKDPEKPNQFHWSSSSGPEDFSIEAGTICTGEVVISSRRPIDLVFPKLSRALGLRR